MQGTFKVETDERFLPVGPFACPTSEGKTHTFAQVNKVNSESLFIGKQANVIDDVHS